MKTDRAKKIHSLICEKHGSCPPEALQEIEFFEEHDICGDVLSLYNNIKEPGNENKINSLVVYLLGITSQKPTGKFSLEKRRTYGRSGFPDIDMDFDHHRRHEVVEYLFEKYGREYVSNIGTVQRLTTKNCLHKTITVLDPEHSTVFDENGKKVKEDRSANFSLRMRIVNTLPTFLKKQDGSPIESVEEAYNEFPEFRQQMDSYPEVYRAAKKLEGGISAMGCLARDTLIKTKDGWVRIDQLDGKTPVAYVDENGDIQYTTNYKSHKTGNKKCYKMRLESGDWIKVTDEHLIFTNQGCVSFEEIRKNPNYYKVYCVKY